MTEVGGPLLFIYIITFLLYVSFLLINLKFSADKDFQFLFFISVYLILDIQVGLHGMS